jgi:hypothetical protein
MMQAGSIDEVSSVDRNESSTMLNRTGWLILFLGMNSGNFASDQLRVMKGLFLLDQVLSRPLDGSYRFEPYGDSGPVDAMVHRDLDALQIADLIRVDWEFGATKKTYHLTEKGMQRFLELNSTVPARELDEIRVVKQWMTSHTIAEILKRIAA